MSALKTKLTALGLLSGLGAFAQNVGMGTATPDASAKLDISDAARGILLPRVSLSATNVAAPVTSPANWLIVFNTATAGTGATAVSPGLYYWDGTQWVRFQSGTSNSFINAHNGLTEVASDEIILGGTLDQNTTIQQGNFNQIQQLNGTGDWSVNNNTNLPVLRVNDNSTVEIGNDNVNNGSSYAMLFTGLGNTGNSQFARIQLDAFGTAGGERLDFTFSGSGARAVRIGPDVVEARNFYYNNSGTNAPMLINWNSVSAGLQIFNGYTQSSGNFLTMDNSGVGNLMTMRFDGFTGFGTATPAERLHVVGNIRSSSLAGAGTRLVGSDVNGTLTNIAAGTNGQILTMVAGAPTWAAPAATNWALTGNAGTSVASNFIGTTDAVDFATRTNNLERMRITSGGNVLINKTTDNGATFQVNGNSVLTGASNSTGAALLVENSSNFPLLTVNNNLPTGSGIMIRVGGATGSTEIVRNALNVGHSFSSQSNHMFNAGGSAGWLTFGFANNHSTNVWMRMEQLTNTTGTPAAISMFPPLTNSTTAASITTLNIAPNINQTGVSTGIVRGIYYNPTITSIQGTHNAFENTVGNVLLNTSSGNTGIGTSAPADKLHVVGNIRTSSLAGAGTRLVGSDVNGTLTNIAAGTNGQILTMVAGAPAWAANSAWVLDGNTNGALRSIGTNDNFDLPFETNNTERMRITNGGNVGIGTATPGDRLSVNGNMGVGGAVFTGYSPAATSGQGIGFPATSNDFLRIYGQHNGGDVSDLVVESGDNPSDGVLFRNVDCCNGGGTLDYARIGRDVSYYIGGNFGFGTNAPGFKLDVNTASTSEAVARFTSQGNVNIQLAGGANSHQFLRFFENGTGRWEMGNASPSGNGFYINRNVATGANGSAFFIQPSGNVGINTIAPTQRLEVVGTIQATNGGVQTDNGDIYARRPMPAGDATSGLVAIGWANSSRGDYWNSYLADPDGGFGVQPGSWEMWEYPGTAGNLGVCCRQRFRIENTFGLSTYGTVNFTQNGSIQATAFITTSTQRKKQDIADLDHGLAALMRLRPVRYSYNYDPHKLPQYGLIAEEVEAVLPDLVYRTDANQMATAKGGEIQGLNYDGLVPVLIKSVQEQQAQIELLKAQNKALEERLQKLENRQ